MTLPVYAVQAIKADNFLHWSYTQPRVLHASTKLQNALTKSNRS